MTVLSKVSEGLAICMQYAPDAPVFACDGFIVVMMQCTGVISNDDCERLRALGWEFDGDESEWVQIFAYPDE